MNPRPKADQIPLDELEHGRVYKVRSRNLVVGVWNAPSRGFLGIREKFGNRFLFQEFHYDNGPPFGTAWAVQASNIVTTVPEKYWKPADGDALRTLLLPLHFDILEEQRREWAALEEEARSLAMRPQTLPEYRRAQAVEAVRQWRRDQMLEVPEGEPRAQRMSALHEEYVTRLTTAMKENPVD